jgi:PEP-CTERM motif
MDRPGEHFFNRAQNIMHKRTQHFFAATTLALSLLAAGQDASAAYTPVTLSFDDLSADTGPGLPLGNYGGFTFDAGTFYINVTNPLTLESNSYLITNDALTIRRTDNQAFYFDSVDHAMRGGETREYYFVIHFADGTTFSGEHLNTADAGNFRNDVGITELSGTDQLISSFSVLGKQTEIADYSYLALDNFQFRVDEGAVTSPVPEPETYAMLLAGLGLMGCVVRRRRG